MKIVVTGGAGRLGESVVRRLAEAGHEVVCVDRARINGLPAEQVSVDLRDRDATHAMMMSQSPDAVVHLAAIAVPFSEPEDIILATNGGMAYNVLDAASASGVFRILDSTSPTTLGYGAPYGWRPQYLPLDEEHPVSPWNAYALSKQLIENMVAMFARKNPETSYGAFRPCFVVSPQEWNGAPTQQGHSLAERLNDPSLAAVSLFNYVDARDAAEFVLVWLERAQDIQNGSVFFVCADDALALEPLAELIPRYNPSWAALASGLTCSAPAFTSAKARNLLGWQPTRSWRTELSASQRALLVPRIPSLDGEQK